MPQTLTSAREKQFKQEKASKVPGREGRQARGQPVSCRTVRPGDEHIALNTGVACHQNTGKWWR